MPTSKQIHCYFLLNLIKCENPCYFVLIKCENAKDSHIFSTKNNSVFVIFMFEIWTNR